VNADVAEIDVTIPQVGGNGIGTYFHRAVASSPPFIRNFSVNPWGLSLRMTGTLAWLKNGLSDAIAGFLKEWQKLESATYHLTDSVRVIPAAINISTSLETKGE
jgi:hypothetical protein